MLMSADQLQTTALVQKPIAGYHCSVALNHALDVSVCMAAPLLQWHWSCVMTPCCMVHGGTGRGGRGKH